MKHAFVVSAGLLLWQRYIRCSELGQFGFFGNQLVDYTWIGQR